MLKKCVHTTHLNIQYDFIQQTMTNNLWEVNNISDLLFFLKKSEEKFVVLSVLLQTHLHTKVAKTIRKFIKTKSTEYKHILFLLYVAKPTDFGKISILDKNELSYPKMCHIFEVTNLLLEVNAIDGIDILNESFNKLEEYYNPPQQISKPQYSSKQKLDEKIAILTTKAEEFNMLFIKECHDRKLIDEKNITHL